jgi:hypothetical protein
MRRYVARFKDHHNLIGVSPAIPYWPIPPTLAVILKYNISKQALKQELESFDKKKLIGSLKLAAGKKAISDFRKFKPSMDSLIDLMLYYVENGVGYTNEFGILMKGFIQV